MPWVSEVPVLAHSDGQPNRMFIHRPARSERPQLPRTGCEPTRRDVGVPAETPAHAAERVLGSEPQDAAQPTVDVIHEGSRQLAHRLIEICLVKGNQGSDVDN
jgi:hypothetical protein